MTREEAWKKLADAQDPLKRRLVRKKARDPHYPKDRCKDTKASGDNKWKLAITSRVGLNQLRIAADPSGDPVEDSVHFRHEQKKFHVSYILKTWGLRFATEAEFIENGCRTDVYSLDAPSADGGTIEAESNQSEKNVERKVGLWRMPCLNIDPRESFSETKEKLRAWLNKEDV